MITEYCSNDDFENSIGFLLRKYIGLEPNKNLDRTVRVEGKVKSKRGHAKQLVFEVSDSTGSIKCVAKEDILRFRYNSLLWMGINCYIGIEGDLICMGDGILTILVTKFSLIWEDIDIERGQTEV